MKRLRHPPTGDVSDRMVLDRPPQEGADKALPSASARADIVGSRLCPQAAAMGKPMHAGIRRLKESDIVSLRKLIGDTIIVSYGHVYPPRAVEFFKDFHAAPKILERGRLGTVLVVEENGELIATGSLVDGEIFAVFVHPDYQQAGLGKALMTTLEDQARASGVTESVLSVSLPSKRFYEGIGYEMVQACSRDLGDGQRLDFWKAKKRLMPEGA